MSAELITARKKLSSVSTNLKKGKYMPAVQAVHDGLLTMLRQSLMKSERTEFEELLKKVAYSLNSDDNLRKVYPLVINYEPGKEKVFLDAMVELLRLLQEKMNEDAQLDIAAIEARKRKDLAEGQKHLDNQSFDKAKSVFDKLIGDFGSDIDLKADIADRYLKAERYQEAFNLLDDALRDDPNAIFLYNRIGIVLRKMKDFETAEKYYLKALAICQDDEYLLFNMGRLYFDWKKWPKMAKAAERAMDINPDFKEAAKMKAFALKKMG
ncbi:tetratricopeptide repeat protein [Pseudodesulfovibrio senegalensis]|jgi:tetratricopeptide (TPR) repeat protein|uniref:Tetratricopeptide repeat protein n=1 Tax=Pseudodesulfovibrio senegalensis TaxID=1721087 RepID=A0A6N6N478_9BACT|nr:tetratricopeptide repeat protein [Pseudodesulfovibrio senegalensis]KAB1442300.1 tetratricopeptide repeat protein [Pseudodesulfovibrio senegalensis]